jgi:prevent-host-death family protein
MCHILCVLDRVGVRELRQNLSVYLRRVSRGESLEVTERGRPVAVVRPIEAPDDAVTRPIARGVAMRRGRGSLADLRPPARAAVDRPLSEDVQEMREEQL